MKHEPTSTTQRPMNWARARRNFTDHSFSDTRLNEFSILESDLNTRLATRFLAWQTRCSVNCRGEVSVLTVPERKREDNDERARFVTVSRTAGRGPRRTNRRRKKRAGRVGPRPWGRQYVLRAVQGDPAEGSSVLLCSCRKSITIATNVSAAITRQGGKDCCQRWPGKCPWCQPRGSQRSSPPPSFRDHRRKASVADRKHRWRAQRSGIRKIGLNRSSERLQGVRLCPVRDWHWFITLQG